MSDRETTPSSRTLSRRTVLRLGGTAAAAAATGPFVFTPARAQGFNWKRFQGKELYLLLTKHPGSTSSRRTSPSSSRSRA
jgi:hypothetical protein